MKRDGVQHLAWNEEFYIKAEKQTKFGTKTIKTTRGKGYSIRFLAEKEAEKLKSLGYEKIRIYVRKWWEE